MRSTLSSIPRISFCGVCLAQSPNGENPISDGKVNGDHISFKTHFDVNDHECAIHGDAIDLKVAGPWGENEVTLKRAAERKSP
ncbi:MAG TPA: hypothetical protein VFQ24_04625 [Terriglobia bacterium]|nr:hypothetical protein [Terriglobia bacterium]